MTRRGIAQTEAQAEQSLEVLLKFHDALLDELQVMWAFFYHPLRVRHAAAGSAPKQHSQPSLGT